MVEEQSGRFTHTRARRPLLRFAALPRGRVDATMRPMLSLAIGLPKGGTGKTTTAVTLAHGLALRGRRVILVDVDEQGAAARALGVDPPAGLADLVDGRDPAACMVEARPRLWLVAGGPRLASTKRDIARRDIAAERVLSEALARLDQAADLVILDMAPAVDSMAINSVWYARRVLSPVALEALAVAALPAFVDRLDQVARYRGLPFAAVAILPTMYDRRIRQAAEILDQLHHHYPDQVLPPIPRNVAMSQAQARGLTIWEYDPKAAAAAAYADLVDYYEEQTT